MEWFWKRTTPCRDSSNSCFVLVDTFFVFLQCIGHFSYSFLFCRSLEQSCQLLNLTCWVTVPVAPKRISVRQCEMQPCGECKMTSPLCHFGATNCQLTEQPTKRGRLFPSVISMDISQFSDANGTRKFDATSKTKQKKLTHVPPQNNSLYFPVHSICKESCFGWMPPVINVFKGYWHSKDCIVSCVFAETITLGHFWKWFEWTWRMLVLSPTICALWSYFYTTSVLTVFGCNQQIFQSGIQGKKYAKLST